MKERLVILAFGLIAVCLAGPANGMLWNMYGAPAEFTEHSYCQGNVTSRVAYGTIQIRGRTVRTCTYQAFCNLGDGEPPNGGFLARCLSAEHACPSPLACAAARYEDDEVERLLSAGVALVDGSYNHLTRSSEGGTDDASLWLQSDVSPYPEGFPHRVGSYQEN